MKPQLTTKIEHTINFYTNENFARLNVFGLSDLFTFNYAKEFVKLNINLPNSNVSFNNIMPTPLSDWDLGELDQIIKDGNISTQTQLYPMLVYLVNKEVLPAGDYVISFKL